MDKTQEKLKGYTFIEKIGEGTYGLVWKAKNNINGQIVAIKEFKIKRKGVEYDGIPSTVLREISYLKKLNYHINVVELVEIISNTNGLFLVLEYIELDVHSLLYAKNPYKDSRLPNLVVKEIMYQLLNVIDACHSKRVLHRDLKPSNLLYNLQTKLIKLADFGLARKFEIPLRPLSVEIQSLWYRSPEILLGINKYSRGVDIWAIGCIFYELSHNEPLFRGDSEIGQLFKIGSILGWPSDEDWPEFKKLPNFKCDWPQFDIKGLNSKSSKSGLRSVCNNLCFEGVDMLEKLIVWDPNKRLFPGELLSHPYFDDLR